MNSLLFCLLLSEAGRNLGHSLSSLSSGELLFAVVASLGVTGIAFWTAGLIRSAQSTPPNNRHGGEMKEETKPKDGHYDNTSQMRRELWKDGKLVAFWTAESIQRGDYPKAPGWGTFPLFPPPNTSQGKEG